MTKTIATSAPSVLSEVVDSTMPRSRPSSRVRRALDWESVSVSDLPLTNPTASGVAEVLPQCTAIYAWRLSLEIDTPPEDVAALIEQLKRLSELPQGRVENVALSRALHLEGLTVGGGGLTPEKLGFFREYASDPSRARWLLRFMRSIEQRTPVLYVGKAKDLPTRISQHLSGETDFGSRVMTGEDFEWNDLKVEFLDLGPVNSVSDGALTAFEQLYTVMSVASYTKRAG